MTKLQPTILVVDDEPDVGRYIAATLTRSGFNAVLTIGGGAALCEYRTRKNDGRAIRLVLTDVMMSDLSGPDLAHALRAFDPKVHILYMSGYRRDHLERFGDEIGSDEVLSKPFTPAELVTAVRRAIEGPQIVRGASGS